MKRKRKKKSHASSTQSSNDMKLNQNHNQELTSSSSSEQYLNSANPPEEAANYLQLIESAIKGMGGKATGSEITDWIANRHKELGTNKKKLTYTVNAILSSKKYNNLFIKDQMVNNGQRALWKLNTKTKSKPASTKG